jgi:hypothetical protein
MESIKHLEYMYHRAMCLERVSPSPQPSTDSGVIFSDDCDGRLRQLYVSYIAINFRLSSVLCLGPSNTERLKQWLEDVEFHNRTVLRCVALNKMALFGWNLHEESSFWSTFCKLSLCNLSLLTLILLSGQFENCHSVLCYFSVTSITVNYVGPYGT